MADDHHGGGRGVLYFGFWGELCVGIIRPQRAPLLQHTHTHTNVCTKHILSDLDVYHPRQLHTRGRVGDIQGLGTKGRWGDGMSVSYVVRSSHNLCDHPDWGSRMYPNVAMGAGWVPPPAAAAMAMMVRRRGRWHDRKAAVEDDWCTAVDAATSSRSRSKSRGRGRGRGRGEGRMQAGPPAARKPGIDSPLRSVWGVGLLRSDSVEARRLRVDQHPPVGISRSTAYPRVGFQTNQSIDRFPTCMSLCLVPAPASLNRRGGRPCGAAPCTLGH